MKNKIKYIVISILSVIVLISTVYAMGTTEIGAAILSVIVKTLAILFLIAATGITLIGIRFVIYDKKSLALMTAIHNYRMDILSDGKTPDIGYEDMEGMDVSIGRWWDWKFNHILPPDKYELVRPYIEYDKIFSKGDNK